MDRREALFWFFVVLLGSWVVFPTDLTLSQSYDTAYGHNVLVASTIIAIITGAIGVLLYLVWPTSKSHALDQPQLNIAIAKVKPEEEVKRVQVWFRNGQKRSHEARFCFITITNSGKRTAENVRLYCGMDQMLLMPFKHKPDYKVDYEWSVEDFDKSVKEIQYEEEKMNVETFVIATLNGVKQRDSTIISPSPLGERFVLFFTMKDFGPLSVPGFTRIYEHPRGSPPTVNLYVEVHYRDGLGYYAVDFEVVLESWDRFKPRLVNVEFKPYTYS